MSVSTTAIRRDGNHLAGQQSLYLLQHAHNPVDWYPWGTEALNRARAEDKLIFLSIGYSSCHWCHVMEEEVFENDSVAGLLNRHYICIKVDREERPDLDAVYMNAVQLMNGRGGWPLNVYLTPELKPFFGATYMPADQFTHLSTRLHNTYRDDPRRIVEVADELARTMQLDITPAGSSRADFDGLVDKVMANAWRWFDDEWGGFGSSQKFPTPPRWRFALHYYRQAGDPEVARRLRLTLDRMGDGGIRDHIAGGFHRYTVDRTWTVPHFEKMLYDNCQLAALYTEAAEVFASGHYSAIARSTLDFMLAEMYDPAGGFYASFDADSGGEEGTYYVWTPAELASVAGAGDAAALALLLGVSAEGNFEGANVLTRRIEVEQAARELGRPVEELAGLVEHWRPALVEYRAQRTAPTLDRKIVTAWNGLAIEALAEGYIHFGDERYLAAAEQTAGFIWNRHRHSTGELYRASTAGIPGGPGILDDYALLANGLLALFTATGDEQHLSRAIELTGHVLEHFDHPEAGCYLTADGTPAPLGRQVEIYDSVEPSGNAMLLRVLQNLHALTGNSEYAEFLGKTLAVYAGMLGSAGVEMATWHDVVLLEQNPLHTVIIAGAMNTPGGAELLAAARAGNAPYALIVPVPADGASPELLALMPSVAGKLAKAGRAVAYVCEVGTCQAPAGEAAELQRQIRDGWWY